MKKISLLLLFLLVAFISYSQSLLFRDTGDKVKHTVYILGTIHALPQMVGR
jgi:hypothetical protein